MASIRGCIFQHGFPKAHQTIALDAFWGKLVSCSSALKQKCDFVWLLSESATSNMHPKMLLKQLPLGQFAEQRPPVPEP
jgi:hypothetical protein